MSTVTIGLDIQPAIRFLTDVDQRQIPFALARAANVTAKEFQDAMRSGISNRFTVRQTKFVLDSVKIERGNFATSKGFSTGGGQFSATVSMGGEGSSHRNSGLLVKYEDGGDEQSADPSRPLIIPTTAIRPTFAELPQRSLYPKNLRLLPRRGVTGILPATGRVTRRGVVQLQGKQRTFVLDPTTMHGVSVWGVYQRYGSGPHDFQLIWRYRTHVRIPARLEWKLTAEQLVPVRFPENFKLMLALARQTAR